MSIMQDWDYQEGEPQQERNPLRDVVKTLEQQNKELAEKLDKALAAVENEQKERRKLMVKSTLTERGLPEKVASLIPEDKDPNEWLEEWGDVFGVKKEQSQEPEQAKEPPAGMTEDQVKAMQDISNAVVGATVPGTPMEQQMAILTSPTLTREQLDQMIRAAGGNA